jgi:hypothetical protein
MQEVRKERLASVDVLWNKGMPMREINDYLGLGLPEFEGWDTGYMPFSVSPVGSAPDPESDPALGETDAENSAPGETDPTSTEPVTEMLRALRAQRAPAPAPTAESEFCGCGCGDGEIDTRGRPAAEIAAWKSHMAKRQASLRACHAKITKVLMTARAEVLRKLEARKAVLDVTARSGAMDFIFNLAGFKIELNAALRGAASNTLQTAGEQLFKELGKDSPWKMPAQAAVDFFARRENKLVNVADEIHGRIMGALKEGLDAGDTLAEMAGRVRSEFNEISRGRAMVIARTETSAAYGVAREAAMRSAGVQYKRWLTSGNSIVRTAHKAMNRATVRVNERFTVVDPKSGKVDKVFHPGDPDGAPWNVINCACVCVAETKPEDGSDTTEQA